MNLNRRHFLFILGATIGSFALDGYTLAEENIPSNERITMAEKTEDIVKLPPLPYPYEALEPYIDEQTMRFHHDKHHASYVKNLNAALTKHPELKSQSIEDLLKNLDDIPRDIQNIVCNNGGGHLNHTMFWTIMKPNGGGEPNKEIASAIKKDFGNFNNFKKQFNQAGAKHFGSGWTWLVLNKNDKLEVMSTANQNSPLSEGKYPIMGNDIWEHAYYLNYQNRRKDYLEAWWNVVNWDEVNKRFTVAKKSISL
ncbi:Manganese superoxide dismutase [Richelia intracellularis HH01]|jgi:Fe-Mn family superoxide dismutase|uniref:Superoxide dismutase n=1 Tax=Richelia intracellularis HH01 TaxID=1165094 RepID=M1X6H3_9NOST|nr:superoxide dismutase [Richelia intracellularis]CCH68136.1 Manganese superoxide dismutase [Richelia intracellularis HH01]